MRKAYAPLMAAAVVSGCLMAFINTALADDTVSQSSDAAHTIYLSATDWPPYALAADGSGATEAVVRAAFAAVGYQVVTHYYPWMRAVSLSQGGGKYIGYYPAYASPERQESCYLSDLVGESPVGLVERRDRGLADKTLDQLQDVGIGVVAGYVNGREFDRRVQDGKLRVEPANDDLTNLRKVYSGRVAAAVMDHNVMAHLLAVNAGQFPLANQLLFANPGMQPLTLHVCFRRDEEGRKAAVLLNEGLSKIDARAISAASLKGIRHSALQ